MKRNITILGARGLLGHACRRRFDHTDNVSFPLNGDLRDYDTAEAIISELKPSIVINCAGKVGGVGANKEYPVEFMLDNLKIQMSVLETCHTHGVEKVVMVGTSCLYPDHAPLPVAEESLLTGSFTPDVAAYATAKLAGLELCRSYAKEYGKNFMMVNPANIYGLNDNYGPSAHVVPGLIRRLKEAKDNNKPLVVWGDGTAVREFIYADDVANAISYVLESWNSPEPINIGTGIGTNIRSLVDTLMKVANIEVEVQWDKTKPVGIQNKTFNINKIQHLGWGPEVSLSEGLLKTWVDFLENPNLRNK